LSITATEGVGPFRAEKKRGPPGAAITARAALISPKITV
jgi:hypothetical protein